MILDISIIAIVFGLIFANWYDLYHVTKMKPQKAICYKCKYCIKQRQPFLWGYVTKISCRTPEDQGVTNYLTGKVHKLNFNCDIRNSRGQCPDYRKKWWKW